MSSPTAAALEVNDDKYAALLAQDGQGLRIQFRGTISTVNPASLLNPFVDAVHARALAAGAKELRVDLTQLEFCNSSGFKSFIHWIEKIQALPQEQRYRLRFVSTRERRWQRASLLALSCYGFNIVVTEGI